MGEETGVPQLCGPTRSREECSRPASPATRELKPSWGVRNSCLWQGYNPTWGRAGVSQCSWFSHRFSPPLLLDSVEEMPLLSLHPWLLLIQYDKQRQHSSGVSSTLEPGVWRDLLKVIYSKTKSTALAEPELNPGLLNQSTVPEFSLSFPPSCALRCS